MEQYTFEEFSDACAKVLRTEAYHAGCRAGLNIDGWCKLVAKEMLLNKLMCSDTNVLRVIQVTAHNLWEGDGCHNLSLLKE